MLSTTEEKCMLRRKFELLKESHITLIVKTETRAKNVQRTAQRRAREESRM